MAILHFPARGPRRSGPAGGAAILQELLAECRGRRAGLRRDGMRLRAAARRLRALSRSMARSRDRLSRWHGRLRACRAALSSPGGPGPAAV
jgi:hypothetical protein